MSKGVGHSADTRSELGPNLHNNVIRHTSIVFKRNHICYHTIKVNTNSIQTNSKNSEIEVSNPIATKRIRFSASYSLGSQQGTEVTWIVSWTAPFGARGVRIY